jgi:hypothetical protein
MISASSAQVTLKVHLAGAIAYVPEGAALWALLPNGLLPTPARWRIENKPQFLRARAAHLALFLTDHELINYEKTSAKITTILEPWSAAKLPPNALFPLTPSRKILGHLLGYGLDFGFPDDKLTIENNVKDFVPKMLEISRAHAMADRRYLPGSQGFDYSGLSSALRLNRGTLSVGGYFGGVNQAKLDFGYVNVSPKGQVIFKSIVWQKPVANHLIWTVDLPKGTDRITIMANDWANGQQKKFVLRVPRNRRCIEVAVLHSEAELPTLFTEDPFLSIGTSPLPDPDFELLYSVSSNQHRRSRWRVPVSSPGGAGGDEKPCTGGMYAGFK